MQYNSIRLIIMILIAAILSGCNKHIPLEMVAHGTLEKDDYYMLDWACKGKTTKKHISEIRSGTEKLVPSYVWYIKKPDIDFSLNEFIAPLKPEQLCQSIHSDFNQLTFKAPMNTIEWLNELIKKTDFFEMVENKKNIPLSLDIQRLVKLKHETITGYTFDQLYDRQKSIVKKLNRLLIEEMYPDKIPKRKYEEEIDFNDMRVAILDFKSLDSNIDETAIKQACDELAKKLEKWKVFKKVDRSVQSNTDIIMTGTIVKYKSVEGVDKVVAHIAGRFAEKYAYWILELKLINAKTREKIGALQLTHVYGVVSAWQSGRPEKFFADEFRNLFEYDIKRFDFGYYGCSDYGVDPVWEKEKQ